MHESLASPNVKLRVYVKVVGKFRSTWTPDGLPESSSIAAFPYINSRTIILSTIVIHSRKIEAENVIQNVIPAAAYDIVMHKNIVCRSLNECSIRIKVGVDHNNRKELKV
ncbi:S-adenosylmethionine synthase [Striga asiatica]|uniref:S-adenosylmethionine synthase n=1 Tax=Striga asiatica TaxID=4170 RepID=A0A5A7RGY2_STRAF|nr:S-adenosylmethionine synthase [Striga asiatica]